MFELELTKANRLRLARAFRDCPRVDLAIECAIEGQMGRAFVDDPASPAAWTIAAGPFRYFAGDAHSPGGMEMIRLLPPQSLLMPSAGDWSAVIRQVHGERLAAYPRYTFAVDALSAGHLDGLLRQSRYRDAIRRVDAALAARLLADPDGPADLSLFDSAGDFVERGVGFCVVDGDTVAGAACSAAVCSRGIEVSIYVMPRYRRRGMATALAATLAGHCLAAGLEPHWDAANPDSYHLALKLGYRYVGMYEACCLGDSTDLSQP
jgi:GNAT superfamily N-acetyltransferase